jgi:hypothetical protein
MFSVPQCPFGKSDGEFALLGSGGSLFFIARRKIIVYN